MKATNSLSNGRINLIREQGYELFNDSEIRQLAWGNRFAYRLCGSILIVGVALGNIPILFGMMIIALFGVILPNHPFDYIYNGILSKRMGKPKVPPRSMQLIFACTIATFWIGATIILFHNNMMTSGYISGSILIGVATLVATIDLCIPSKIYNAIFSKKTTSTQIIS